MVKKKIVWTAIIVSVAFVFFYCGGHPAVEPDVVYSDPSFHNHIQPFFTNNCALNGCHNSTARAGLVLLNGPAYINLVNIASTQEPNRMRVLPGDAANSYLVIKIEGNQTVGTPMPQGRDPLDEVQIQNLKNWINKGAKNN